MAHGGSLLHAAWPVSKFSIPLIPSDRDTYASIRAQEILNSQKALPRWGVMVPYFLGTLHGWPEYGLLQRALHCGGDSRFGRCRAASVQSQRKLGHEPSATRCSRRSRFERSLLSITSHAQFKMPPVVGNCVKPSDATCICILLLNNKKGFEINSLR